VKHPNNLPKLEQSVFWQFLKELLIEGYSTYSSSTSAPTGSTFTTSGGAGNDLVVVNSATSTTVTLHTPAKEGQTVTVKRWGVGAVTIVPGDVVNETIDGCLSVAIPSRYDAPKLTWIESINGWAIT